MRPFKVDRIAGVALKVCDLASAARFYVDGLGFHPAEALDGRLNLRLGAQAIVLERSDTVAPRSDPANAREFQHFAIVVSDMAAAHAHLMRLKPEAISRGGPQRLPASSGGVTAWKFRGPEGQPLELIEAPSQAWRETAGRAPGDLFLGIDHSALGCTDLPAAFAFYEGLGFRKGPGSHNHGPEQERLDGLDGVDLEIATLFAPAEGLHIELLHYRRPPARPASSPNDDVALLLSGDGEGPSRLLDADGHALRIEGAAT